MGVLPNNDGKRDGEPTCPKDFDWFSNQKTIKSAEDPEVHCFLSIYRCVRDVYSDCCKPCETLSGR
jgi:hypothetical protein